MAILMYAHTSRSNTYVYDGDENKINATKMVAALRFKIIQAVK